MHSQSFVAQLARMTLLLSVCLVAVQFSPSLRDFIATHAIDSGCHQHIDFAAGHASSQHHHHHH